MAGEFDLVLAVSRPPHPDTTITCELDTPAEEVHPWCTYLDDKSRIQAQSFLNEIASLYKTIDVLFWKPQNDNSTRPSRTLDEDVVISSGFLGLAKHQDVVSLGETVAKVISQVNKKEHVIDENLDLVHALVSNTADAIQTLQQESQLHKQQIIAIVNSTVKIGAVLEYIELDLQNTKDYITNLSNYKSKIINERLSLLMRLQRCISLLENYIEGVQIASKGYLDPKLIQPEQFKISLQQVKRAIKQRYPMHEIIADDIYYYYSNKLVSAIYLEDHLYIHIKIPFYPIESRYELFQVYSHEVPLHPDDINSIGYTVIKNLPDYIAFHPSSMLYTEITKSQLDNCEGTRTLICSDLMIHHRPTYTCIASLYFNQEHRTNETCDVQAIFKPVPTKFHQVGPTQFMVTTSAKSYQLISQNSHKTIREIKNPSSYFKITLPCNTMVYIAGLSLLAPMTACGKNDQTLQVQYAINYWVFKEWDYKMSQLPPLVLTNQSVTLAIPNIHNYLEKYSDYSKGMMKTGIALEDISDKIKNLKDQNREKAPGGKFKFGLIAQNSDVVFTYMLVAGTLILALIIAMTIVARRLSNLRNLVLASLGLYSVTGARGLHLTPPGPSQTTTTEVPMPVPSLKVQDDSLIILQLVVFCAMCYIIYKIAAKVFPIFTKCMYNCLPLFRKCRSRNPTTLSQTPYKTQVLLHITNGSKQLTLKLFHLPYPFSIITVEERPRMEQLQALSGVDSVCYKPIVLSLTWSSDMKYRIFDSKIFAHVLPTTVTIPSGLATQFREMVTGQQVMKLQAFLFVTEQPEQCFLMSETNQDTVYHRIALCQPLNPGSLGDPMEGRLSALNQDYAAMGHPIYSELEEPISSNE